MDPEFFHYQTEDELLKSLKKHQVVKVGEKVLIISSFASDLAKRRTDSLSLIDVK